MIVSLLSELAHLLIGFALFPQISGNLSKIFCAFGIKNLKSISNEAGYMNSD